MIQDEVNFMTSPTTCEFRMHFKKGLGIRIGVEQRSVSGTEAFTRVCFEQTQIEVVNAQGPVIPVFEIDVTCVKVACSPDVEDSFLTALEFVKLTAFRHAQYPRSLKCVEIALELLWEFIGLIAKSLCLFLCSRR